jgi:hypothetical protein
MTIKTGLGLYADKGTKLGVLHCYINGEDIIRCVPIMMPITSCATFSSQKYGEQ